MLSLEELSSLFEAHREAATASVREFSVGDRFFAFNSQPAPALMGVINFSADSWYRESVCLSVDAGLRRARILHAQGADVIDVGAESTLAHAARVDDKGQNSVLLPMLRTLSEEKIPVSIETYQFDVAKACLEAGANVINLTGRERSEEIYKLLAAYDAAVIICYVQGRNVREVDRLDLGKDPMGHLQDYFAREIQQATNQGVTKIFIDPGLGFYYRNLTDGRARVRHQIRTLLNTFRLRRLGFPTCHALPHAVEYFGDEVRSAEPFFATLAALGRTDLLRTHEIPKVKGVVDTLNAY